MHQIEGCEPVPLLGGRDAVCALERHFESEQVEGPEGTECAIWAVIGTVRPYEGLLTDAVAGVAA